MNVMGRRMEMVATGPMPGQDTDQGSEEDAEKAVGQVYRLQGGLKSQKDVLGQLHQPIPKNPEGN